MFRERVFETDVRKWSEFVLKLLTRVGLGLRISFIITFSCTSSMITNTYNFQELPRNNRGMCKLPVTWGKAVVFAGYGRFPPPVPTG